MVDDARISKRDLPVIINNEHFMTKAEVIREPDRVTIYIFGKGPNSQLLAELLEQPEVIALSFTSLPIQNIREKKERN